MDMTETLVDVLIASMDKLGPGDRNCVQLAPVLLAELASRGLRITSLIQDGLSETAAGAIEIAEIYRELKDKGFDSDQAFELTQQVLEYKFECMKIQFEAALKNGEANGS